jgi:MFS family permease
LLLVMVGAALHGAGFGLMTTSTFTIVGEIAPLTRRGEAVGYFGAAQPIIQGIGATLGFAVVAAAGFGVLFTSAIAAALLTVVLFLGLHGRTDGLVPSVPLSRLPRLARPVVVPVLACGLLAFVGSSLVLILPLLGEEASVENPGLFYLASAVSGVVARVGTGRLSDRLGRAQVAIPGLALLTLSLVALVAGADIGVVAFIVAGAVYGLAVAAAMPAIQALILDRSPVDQRGMSSAGMGMALDVGFASGSLAIGLLVGVAGPGVGLLIAAAAPLVSMALILLDRRQAHEVAVHA